MPVGQREALSGLVTTIIVSVLFLWRLAAQHEAGVFTGPDALQIWARSVLVLIAISIGVAIAVTIVTHVAEAALTGEKPDDRRDERDRDIERRALTFSWYLLSVGILGVIIDLALGASAFRAMNLILGLCMGSEMFKDALKLWFYRGG